MLRAATLCAMGILALGVSACSGSGRGGGQGGSGPAASGSTSKTGGSGSGRLVGERWRHGPRRPDRLGRWLKFGRRGWQRWRGRRGRRVLQAPAAPPRQHHAPRRLPGIDVRLAQVGLLAGADSAPARNWLIRRTIPIWGNGAVRDNVTCLMWEKANPSTQGTWQASSDCCAALGTSSYAGFNDWRLPTRMEMASLIDPTLGRTAYASPPFTTTSGAYATGSYWWETIQGINGANLAWGYGANGMTSNAYSLAGTNFVARCVRGNGTGEAPNALAVEPPNHYTVANGETTDNYTGLVWQSGFSPTLMAWADAQAYCTSLTLNGHTGFRVPTLGELSSTVNEARVGNAVVLTAFPGTPNGCKDPKYWYWAAESQSATADWGLSYCDGFTGTNVGTTNNGVNDWDYFPTANVRCVRNGP